MLRYFWCLPPLEYPVKTPETSNTASYNPIRRIIIAPILSLISFATDTAYLIKLQGRVNLMIVEHLQDQFILKKSARNNS